MVNFRYHLVSITAVFLALAAGITIGAGVVDRATVDQIERRLADVDGRREDTNRKNDELRSDLTRWSNFAGESGDRLVAGQLAGTPVVVVATNGVNRDLVNSVRSALVTAGAEIDGTIWFTGRWVLDDEDELRQLAGVLDAAPTTDGEDLRAAGVAGIGTAWALGESGPLVTALVETGFLEYEAPATVLVALSELPRPDTLFLIVSGDDADVPPADLAIPLVTRLAGSDVAVLAAQPQRAPMPPPAEGEEDVVPEFVMALRADGAVSGRLSSVDNVDDYRGRIATVLALRELREGRRGHYGFGPDTRIVPRPPPT